MVRPTPNADPEDFFRRLRISSASLRPCQSTKARKPFNPDTDPIPMKQTADPEPSSESTQQGSRPPPPPSLTNHRDERGNSARHLFDHRKDDPVRFSVMTTSAMHTSGWSTLSHSEAFRRLCICFVNFVLRYFHFFICFYPLFYNRRFIHFLGPLRQKTKSRPSRNQCFLGPIERVVPTNRKSRK